MNFELLEQTPAFIIDQAQINANLATLSYLKQHTGCRILYSVKALPLAKLMQQMLSIVDGFSVSSLYEARLADSVLQGNGSIHITTPGLREQEFAEINQLCSHISFNSYSQYQRLKSADSSFGLRINPKQSFLTDARFDPCRQYSKLGLDINTLDSLPNDITGLHFHTVFSSGCYQSLIANIDILIHKLGHQLAQLDWLNLGGGYLYGEIENHQPFIDLVNQLQQQFNLQVYIEPGKAVVGNAGYLVATVIDRLVSDGQQIAVLDTSVNHHPELFEYQKSPQLCNEDKQAVNDCLLVGSSCLAGDILGKYQFKTLPNIGEQCVFSHVGAYSLIKANRFNGYGLPDVYMMDMAQTLSIVKQDSYQHYYQQWGM